MLKYADIYRYIIVCRPYANICRHMHSIITNMQIYGMQEYAKNDVKKYA